MEQELLDFFTEDVLQTMREEHTFREMRLITSPEAGHVTLSCGEQSLDSASKAHKVLMLASNSYLDLCNEPALKRAAADAVLSWGTGSGGARLTTGNKSPHEFLEQTIAEFKGDEAAITFATGYMANVGTLSALCCPQLKRDGSVSECVVFSDELNHASIIDGIKLSKAKCFVYKHNNVPDLERCIKEACKMTEPFRKRLLIVSDGVFSMDGDLARLPELQKIAKKYGALLMIDEAHATGVVGKTGRGLVEFFRDKGEPCEHADVTVGTLSKAVGCEGGFVTGKRQLIDFLRNKARSFIFTTSMSPAMAQAAANNIRYMDEHPERVQKLKKNVQFFCGALKKYGVKIAGHTQNLDFLPQSAIIPIVIGDEQAALNASKILLERGVLIPAIRYPTVAKGEARLRASLMASHSREDLEFAAKMIAEVLG